MLSDYRESEASTLACFTGEENIPNVCSTSPPSRSHNIRNEGQGLKRKIELDGIPTENSKHVKIQIEIPVL